MGHSQVNWAALADPNLRLDLLPETTIRNLERSGFLFASSLAKTLPVLRMYLASSFSELNVSEITSPALPASTRSTILT